MRNLDLLKQLGMLGPKQKKGKKPPKKKKKSVPPPSRMSNRLKGAEPVMDYAKPQSIHPIQRGTAERGLVPTSYRNLVTGTLETYDETHRATLAAAGAYKPFVDGAPVTFAPHFDACQHCQMRASRPLSACSVCRSPHGRVCGVCLWERYAENVVELDARTWRCPHCRGICNCPECRLAQGWGSLGEGALEEAKEGGYLSIAHMVVDKRFRVNGTVDNDPNPVRKRGRPLGGGGEWLRRLRRVQRTCSFDRKPIVMQNGVVLNLGTLQWGRPHFHNAEYIYPLGYHVQRVQHIDGGGLFVMDIRILDGGDRPLFRACALDKPDEVYEGTVSSTPITALLNNRAGKYRAISGPRMMYLDEVMVKAALHALSLEHILGTPTALSAYRHLQGEAFLMRGGDFVAVRASQPSRYFLARLRHDAVVMRRDPLAFALTVDWGECVDVRARSYVFSVGIDDVPSHSIFWHFSPGQIHQVGESTWQIAKDVPDLTIECDQVWV